MTCFSRFFGADLAAPCFSVCSAEQTQTQTARLSSAAVVSQTLNFTSAQQQQQQDNLHILLLIPSFSEFHVKAQWRFLSQRLLATNNKKSDSSSTPKVPLPESQTGQKEGKAVAEDGGMGAQEQEEDAAPPAERRPQKSSKEVYFSVLPDRYEPLIEEVEEETEEERRNRKEEKKRKKKRRYKNYRKVGEGRDL